MGCITSSHQVITCPYDYPSRRTFSVNETLPNTFFHLHRKSQSESTYNKLCRLKFQSKISAV